MCIQKAVPSAKTKCRKGVTQGSVLQYFAIWLIKNCFIFISHDYLKFRTMFFLISLNMLNTNIADFRQDTRWQFTAPRVTPFWYFVLALKL